MPYVLVLLGEGANARDEQLHAAAHERFITSLIRRNLVPKGVRTDVKGVYPCEKEEQIDLGYDVRMCP
jgi:hypothetical protein